MPWQHPTAFRLFGAKGTTDTTDAFSREVRMLQRRWENTNEGWKEFILIRPDTAMTVGELASFEIAQAAAASANSGSTTSLTDTAAFTADAFASGLVGGCFLHIVNNDSSAGAAPEGEVSRITVNTVDTLTVETAFTAAVAVSDTYVIIRLGVVEDAAVGDTQHEIAGLIQGTHPSNDFGWAQRKGFNPAFAVGNDTAEIAGNPMIAGTSIVSNTASNTFTLGVFLGGARASDTARDFHPGYIWLP